MEDYEITRIKEYMFEEHIKSPDLSKRPDLAKQQAKIIIERQNMRRISHPEVNNYYSMIIDDSFKEP